MGKTTPPHTHIHKKGDPRIFVFGSNRQGIHLGGAAAYASRDLRAQEGVGEGLSGGSYALPTCSVPGVPLSLDQVRVHVQRFMSFAVANLHLRFFVSALGTGIAGFSEEDMAVLFDGCPGNCDLPPGWREVQALDAVIKSARVRDGAEPHR